MQKFLKRHLDAILMIAIIIFANAGWIYCMSVHCNQNFACVIACVSWALPLISCDGNQPTEPENKRKDAETDD